MKRAYLELSFIVCALLGLGSPRAAAVQYLLGRADYVSGNMPSSVAAADFNKDGALDLAVANSADNTVSIFLGKSNSTLAAKVDYAVGSGPVSVAVADFNGDGKLDLAVANEGSSSISILLGNGDGTFQSHVDYPTGLEPVFVAAADVNDDRKLDLVVSTSSLAISILLGRGNGTFAPAVNYPVTGGAGLATSGAAVVADFNGDGKPDIAVAVPFEDVVSVLLGNGDGTFQPYVQYPTPFEPMSVTAADFNRDGRIDLAVAAENVETEPGLVSILLGNGDGTFQSHVDYPAGQCSNSVSVADFNGDGKLDLAVGNVNCGKSYPELDSVSILLGNGDGTFQPYTTNGTGANPTFAIGDFNHDARLDLAIAYQSCFTCGAGTVSILLGNGDGTFPGAATIAEAGTPVTVAAADFNRDGKLDLAVANSTTAAVSILLGNGNGAFQPAANYPVGQTPGSLATGDFNNDGIVDLALTTSANTVAILLGKGDGSFGSSNSYAAGQNPSAVVAGDFNRDGKLDLAVINGVFPLSGYGNGISILLGNGDGTFQAPANFSAPFGISDMAIGDFNGDGILDLAVSTQDENPASISIFLGIGNGSFSPALTTSIQYGGALAVADFNGDGHLDIAVGSQCNCNQFAVLLGNGTGTFQPAVLYTAGNGPQAIVAGDFTGNHVLDLAAANFLDNTVSILPGNGDGTFQPHLDFSVGGDPQIMTTGDFNGDGTLDLVTGNQDTTLSALMSTATLAIFPGNVDFGAEAVGKTSAPMQVKLTNPGTTPLTMTGIHLGGPDATDFHETTNCPAKLVIGHSCDVNVTFTPGATGARFGLLTLSDTAPSPQSIRLKGTGQ